VKILHNLDNSNRGGIQSMIMRLYLWSSHRHDFWAADGSMAPEMRRAGMVLWNGGPPAEAEYDLVIGHTVGGWSCSNAADFAHDRGARFIECMHSIAASPTDPAKVDMFVTQSNLSLAQNMHMPRRRVIYPPIDVQALFEQAGPHDQIGRISRIADGKRGDAFAALAREFPQQPFIMAGDGSSLPGIAAQGIGNLELTGWLTDLPAFYSRLKLFVFPTQDECNCVSVAQAQAALIPVICQDIPALRETTGGLATFCTSHNDFVQAIARYLDDPAPFLDLAQQAQAWARRLYDYPVSVGAWDSLCEEVVNA